MTHSDQEDASAQGESPETNPWWLSKIVDVKRPPQGRYSTRSDERCFTYCSQSAYGRIERKEPWCRSFCIRRVFAHEVRQVVALDNQNKSFPGKRPTYESVKYPLPPEGQRADEVPGGDSESDTYERKLREKEVKYWKEGWYIWYSKSRWAAQEKVDLMMHDLFTQVGWSKHMAKQKAEWAAREREGRVTQDWNNSEPPTMTLTPPPLMPPTYDHVQNLLAPTFKVTTILRESFESGAQRQFAGLLWEKAWTTEPFLLVRNVCKTVWKVWRDEDNKDR